MSFQTIIDSATAISIDKNPIVSQTVTRDQTIRQTSRGGAIYRFKVTPSPGLKWETNRSLITALEEARLGSQTIRINKAGHLWINGYNGAIPSNLLASGLTAYADQTMLTNSPKTIRVSINSAIHNSVTTGGILFNAGDHIQKVGSPYVYTITNTVTKANAVFDYNLSLHRPVLDAASANSFSVNVCQNVAWRVVMTKMPRWTISSTRLIEWDGDFEFMESLL